MTVSPKVYKTKVYKGRLYRLIGGAWFRLAGSRAPDDGVTLYCWRCLRRPPFKPVYGLPCRPCSTALRREYWRKRRANAGRLLYLPDHQGAAALGQAGQHERDAAGRAARLASRVLDRPAAPAPQPDRDPPVADRRLLAWMDVRGVVRECAGVPGPPDHGPRDPLTLDPDDLDAL